MQKSEIPVGFAMALAMNPEAMQKFSLMSEAQKQKVITGIHTIGSKEEMQQYVNFLVNGK